MNDPFGLYQNPSSIFGMRLVESQDHPRYVLPAELIPGVPLPKAFRDEFNKWSREFLGTTNAVPRGMAYVLGGSTIVMRRQDAAVLINTCSA